MKLSHWTLWALTLIIMVCGLVSCQEEPQGDPREGHTVGESIEGTYAVAILEKFQGHLTLDGGHYLFASEGDVEEPIEKSERFFFIGHPSGKYDIEYYDTVNADALLEDLEDGEILLRITFYTDESDASETTSRDRAFLIRNDLDEQRVYFHSIVSELELWGVAKLWEE